MTRLSEQEDFQVALCTAPDQETAERLAELMVSDQLAACVNIVPNITSVYRWNDASGRSAIEKDAEVLMIIKTHAELMAELGDLLDKEHPYDVFELISCNIEQASSAYLEWLENSLRF